MTTRPGKPRGL